MGRVVSEYLLLGGGGITKVVDQATFAEAWRILLPDHLKGLQYRPMLL